MKIIKSLILLLGAAALSTQCLAASPNIRIPMDNYTRESDCSIWLCLPAGFSNGDCSRAMSAFMARQVRIMYKRVYTDLPLARFCFYDQYVMNGKGKESSETVPPAFNFLRDPLDLIFPAAYAADEVQDEEIPIPEDMNYSENEFGKFGGDLYDDPDRGHSFVTRPKATRDEQIVCKPGMVRTWTTCNSDGTNCQTHKQCMQTEVLSFQEFEGEDCSRVSGMEYDDYGVLIDSGTRTSESGTKFCNRVVNETCVYVQGQLQGTCYNYNGQVLYEPDVP